MTPSVSLLLPNYNSVPLGESASLEGGAFIARANDSSAAFFNPAGLAHAERSSISGSAGSFQFGSVSTDDFVNVESSFQQLPALLGVVVNELGGRTNWAGGLSIARVHAWHQKLDAETTLTQGSAANRFRLSTDAEFDAWLASLGVGYERSDRLRLGFTIDAQYTSGSRRQAIADQVITATGLLSTTAGTNAWASAAHLRASAGAQFAVSPTVRLGAVMRTPGWKVMSGGSTSLEALSHAGAATRTVSFFDPDVATDLKLPFELKTGIGWVGTRAQIEVDVFAYAGAGTYSLLETGNTATVVNDDGQGRPPTISTQVYGSPVIDSRGVVNVAVGARYALTSSGAWVLHGGYATDRSPVGDADTTFTKVHLQNVTAGISARTKWFLASAGLHYAAGRSDPILIRGAREEFNYQTDFSVSTVGIVYSLAVLF